MKLNFGITSKTSIVHEIKAVHLISTYEIKYKKIFNNLKTKFYLTINLQMIDFCSNNLNVSFSNNNV